MSRRFFNTMEPSCEIYDAMPKYPIRFFRACPFKNLGLQSSIRYKHKLYMCMYWHIDSSCLNYSKSFIVVVCLFYGEEGRKRDNFNWNLDGTKNRNAQLFETKHPTTLTIDEYYCIKHNKLVLNKRRKAR